MNNHQKAGSSSHIRCQLLAGRCKGAKVRCWLASALHAVDIPTLCGPNDRWVEFRKVRTINSLRHCGPLSCRPHVAWLGPCKRASGCPHATSPAASPAGMPVWWRGCAVFQIWGGGILSQHRCFEGNARIMMVSPSEVRSLTTLRYNVFGPHTSSLIIRA
jgi:hypothetical protein